MKARAVEGPMGCSYVGTSKGKAVLKVGWPSFEGMLRSGREPSERNERC